MTLLKIHDVDVPTTRNNFVNYSRRPLTYIAVQVLYNIIQSNLITHKHHNFIYYLQTLLQILKFGYPAFNILINSILQFCTLVLCVTPFSSQSLTICGIPITILESYVGKMKNTTNGQIYVFSIRALAHGKAKNITQTHQESSPG